jgi:hypothetical protein
LDEAHERITEILAACGEDDPPYLSDVLVNYNRGGATFLERLGQMAEDRGEVDFKWKIRVISDEWGQPVKPGDVVTRKIARNNRDHRGNLTSCMDRNIAIAAGTYEDDYYRHLPFKVDDRGCIECGFEDAVAFINTRGIHGRSGRPLPMNTHPVAAEEPVKCADGQHRTPHYRLYQEVDNEQYEALPVLTEDKPKRTRKAKDDNGDAQVSATL